MADEEIEWSDPYNDLQDMIKLAVCPHCAASYPAFHSPVGTLETLCDSCGWSSREREPGFIHADGRKCYGCQSCLSDLEEE